MSSTKPCSSTARHNQCRTSSTLAELIQKPAGTPAWFPLAQAIREERAELDTPFAQRLVTDHNAALVEHFLNIPVAQREAVIQPNGVLDDGHREPVAVRFRVSHGRSAYPDLVKATQPLRALQDVQARVLSGDESLLVKRDRYARAGRGEEQPMLLDLAVAGERILN